MTLPAAWLIFPLLIGVLSLGCGLLLEGVGQFRVPGALLLPVGLAVVIVISGLTTATDATAELTVPLVVALAVAGLALSPPWRRGRIEPWTATAAVAVYAIYAAPVVLAGEPTFTGYIKLDDTATWLALTDRLMEHGGDLTGLAPSSYEAALDAYKGYPIGSFLPFGIGHELLGIDSAWLFQPSMAFFAAMLALALTELAKPLLRAEWSRAAVAVVAAQPALLFGYVLWGGVKEIATAAVLVLAGATIPLATSAGSYAAVLPFAIACAALLVVLSLSGLVWLGPLLLLALAIAVARLGPRVAIRRAIAVAAVVALLILPLFGSGFDVANNAELRAGDVLGNLVSPLNDFQAMGIWPASDFRYSPDEGLATAILIGIAALAVIAGLAIAIRARALGLPLLFGGGIVSTAAILLAASPWIDAKALAILSPIVLGTAMIGALAIFEGGNRLVGASVAGLVAVGVLWSNVLAYGGLTLAPYDQLSQLEQIGERIAGQGPTLMTDNQPYGVRHFLRDADPEGVSELRRRQIPLRGGGLVDKGDKADTDELQLEGVLVYRTLVLRRSPEQSRPPSPYALVEEGSFYDVWQRPPGPPPTGLQHLPLGSGVQPTGYAKCDQVRRLAESVGPTGQLAYAERPPNVVFALSLFDHPAAWTDPNSELLLPDSEGTASLRIQLPHPGLWRVWLGGSVPGAVDLLVDGQEVGSARQRINYGFYIDLGQLDLASNSHLVELYFHGSDLHPGSAGARAPVGPLVLSSAESAGETIKYLPTSQAEELCGRRLDWIEAIPG